MFESIRQLFKGNKANLPNPQVSPRPSDSLPSTNASREPVAPGSSDPVLARLNHMKPANTGNAPQAGAQAPRRPSSTHFRLQALSASGTGTKSTESASKDADLDKLLNRLDSQN